MPVCKRPRTRGVPQDQAGLAAALITASFQLGSALGLAVFSGTATSRTSHLLAAHTPPPEAPTAGFLCVINDATGTDAKACRYGGSERVILDFPCHST